MVKQRHHYRDPLDVLIIEEGKTCKGCVHKTTLKGVDYCDKPNGRRVPAVKRCRDYQDTE